MLSSRSPQRDITRALLTILAAFFAIGGSTVAAQTRTIRHEEPVAIEWGNVTFVSGGVSVTKAMWFTREAPSFVSSNFTAAQSDCLRACFNESRGTIAGANVWRLDDEAGEAFQTKVQQTCNGIHITTVRSPEDWTDGEPRMKPWKYFMRVSLADSLPQTAKPSVELILLVEKIPSGTAVEISLPAAIADPAVAHYAALNALDETRAREALQWSRMFLVSSATLAAGNRPTITTTGLEEFAVPVAFGIRALAEAAALLGSDRKFDENTHANLTARLGPGDERAFPGIERWFPELPVAASKLRQMDVRVSGRIADLLQISYPIQGVLQAPRVLAEVNEWVIRVGPFRPLPPITTAVEKVRGKSKAYSKEQLAEELKEQPEALSAHLRNMEQLEQRLKTTVQAVAESPKGQAFAKARFFWLPAVEQFHAAVMRDLEDQRFTSDVGATMTDESLRYFATFNPAFLIGKVGFSYAPEQRAGLEAKISGGGLIDPGDKLTVSATSAERSLAGRLSYLLPWTKNVEEGKSSHIEVFGEAGRDDHFRLGSLSSMPFEHKRQNAGLEHLYRHEGERWTMTLTSAALWDAHELTQTTGVPRRRDSGLTLRHRQLWSATFGKSNSPARWEVALEPHAAFSPAIGWRRSFGQAELEVRTKRWWGGDEGDAPRMYVGVSVAGGASTSAVPPALLYRHGDTSRLLGLEAGEFSGRSFYHGQAVYGVRLAHLLRRLFQRENKAEAGAVPPLLHQLCLQAVAELGATPPSGRTLTSYALGLETLEMGAAGVGLRLGYAWSPQSLRSNGRVFSALSWSF